VEDEYSLAEDLSRTLSGGAEVIGPIGTIDEALLKSRGNAAIASSQGINPSFC
jgi:hypothetical protein